MHKFEGYVYKWGEDCDGDIVTPDAFRVVEHPIPLLLNYSSYPVGYVTELESDDTGLRAEGEVASDIEDLPKSEVGLAISGVIEREGNIITHVDLRAVSIVPAHWVPECQRVTLRQEARDGRTERDAEQAGSAAYCGVSDDTEPSEAERQGLHATTS
ncbi:MAG: hypothetical protein M3P51_09695 [Chloroflexota bacterium]|nr:hypothetical protein [Chloroflexota bacterium]